jgi:hypothetical protein
MSFFKKQDPLEAELGTAFTPSEGFTDELRGRVLAAAPRTRYARASRASFATAVAVFMLGTFASFGGVGLAAAGARQTVHAVAHVTINQKPVTRHLTSASDEYPKASQPKVVTKAKPKPVKPAVQAVSPTLIAKKQKTLPFTGISLVATTLAALMLIGLGVGLRRLGSES